MPPFVVKIIAWIVGHPEYMLIGGMVLAIGFMHLEISHKNKLIKEQNAAIEVYQNNIDVLNKGLLMTNKITLIDSQNIAAANQMENLLQLTIEKSNEKDDAPVAPVLRSAIDSLYPASNAKANHKCKASRLHPCL